MLQSLLSERLALIGRVAPQSASNQSITTDYLPPSTLAQFSRILAVAQVGDASGATVTISLIAASDGSGTGAQALLTTGAMDTAGGDNFDILLDFDLSKVQPDRPYLALKFQVVGADCLIGGVVLGGDCRTEPASQHNASTVSEVLG